MKKFWISFIALLMGVVIGVGIWHGIAYKDKLTSFVKDTWSKIESVFVNKDNVSSEEQKPSEDQPTPDKPSEEQINLDGLYYLVVDGDTIFVQIKDSKYGTIHGYIQDSKIYLASDWESEIELEPFHITEDEKYLHVFWIDQENGQEDKIAIYDKATKKLYYDFSNGKQFPGETYEDQLLSEMIKFENFELHEHSFDEIVYSCPPSCNAAGREIRKCLCKKTEMIETSPALGHDYVNGKCTRCGESDPNYVEACEHDWVKDLSYVPTAPSCGEYWDTQYKCSKCNETKLETNGPLPHDWVDGVCSRCGETDPEEPGLEEPHVCEISEWNVVVEPTCLAVGQERRSCDCGYYEEREIPATGHTFDAGICTSCNALDEEFYNNFVGYWFTETTGFKKESFGKYYIQVYKDGDNYIFTRSGYKVENGEIVLYQNSTDYSDPETWTFISTNRIIVFTLTRQDITFNGTYDGQTLVVGDMTFTKTDKPIRYDGSTSYVTPL